MTRLMSLLYVVRPKFTDITDFKMVTAARVGEVGKPLTPLTTPIAFPLAQVGASMVLFRAKAMNVMLPYNWRSMGIEGVTNWERNYRPICGSFLRLRTMRGGRSAKTRHQT